MKIIARISLFVLILFVQFSCNDWMELPPSEGLIRDEFWKTKEDVEAVVMASYITFANMDEKLFKYGEMRGDFVKGDNNQSEDERKIMEGSIYADNGMCNWNDFYKVINYCNEVIWYAHEVQNMDKTFTDYLLYGFLSEAYFIRSLSYFYLVRIFKDVPLVLEPTLTDASDVYIPKSGEDVILAQIKEDLEMAREWATVDGYLSPDENKGRATKASIDALLADIALWTFDYESCIEHVEKIENLRKYKLIPPDEDWFLNYNPGNTLDVIFAFQFDGILMKNSMFDLTVQWSYNYDPSEWAIDIFDNDKNPEVIRGLGKSIKKVSEDDYIIWKYVGSKGDGIEYRTSNATSSGHWIVYRYADVQLMKAEALSQLGRYPEALEIITAIRSRAGFGLPLELRNSAAAYEDAILEERSRELAFEGKRWFDLMRMGRRNNYSRKAELITIMVRNVPSTQKRILQTKLTNPLSWYLPIFKTELERNNKLVQNPYYNF